MRLGILWLAIAISAAATVGAATLEVSGQTIFNGDSLTSAKDVQDSNYTSTDPAIFAGKSSSIQGSGIGVNSFAAGGFTAFVQETPSGGTISVGAHANARINYTGGQITAHSQSHAFATYSLPTQTPLNAKVIWSSNNPTSNPAYYNRSFAQVNGAFLTGHYNAVGPTSGSLEFDLPANTGLHITSYSVADAEASNRYYLTPWVDDHEQHITVNFSLNGSWPGTPEAPWFLPSNRNSPRPSSSFPVGTLGLGINTQLFATTELAFGQPPMGDGIASQLIGGATDAAVQYAVIGPNFASFMLPSALGNGDTTFQLEFNGLAFGLAAGQQFNFLDFAPGGVANFVLSGIGSGNEPNALPLTSAFTFVAPGNATVSITTVPEPTTWVMGLLGLACVCGIALKGSCGRTNVTRS